MYLKSSRYWRDILCSYLEDSILSSIFPKLISRSMLSHIPEGFWLIWGEEIVKLLPNLYGNAKDQEYLRWTACHILFPPQWQGCPWWWRLFQLRFLEGHPVGRTCPDTRQSCRWRAGRELGSRAVEQLAEDWFLTLCRICRVENKAPENLHRKTCTVRHTEIKGFKT